MKLIRSLGVLLFVCCFSLAAFSQGTHYSYPFSVECSTGPVPSGEAVKFTGKFANAADEKVVATYNWTVSAGSIVSGQGTPEITVEEYDETARTITATLNRNLGDREWVGTQKSSSCSVEVEQRRPRLIDEFAVAGTTCEGSHERLLNYFIELNNNPSDQGVIVIYESPKRNDVHEALLRNFIRFRRLDQTRVTFVHGPLRHNAMVQFWRVPLGGANPEILPTNVDAPPPRPPRPELDATEPDLYAIEFSDGLPECRVPMYDLAAYSEVLNAEPRSRGRIVIGRSSRASFARDQREILVEMAANGVTRNRLTFIYKYVRPNRLLEMTELWVIPAKRNRGGKQL